MKIALYAKDARFQYMYSYFKNRAIFIKNKKQFLQLANSIDVLVLGIHGLKDCDLYIEDLMLLKPTCIIFSGIRQYEWYTLPFMTYFYLEDEYVKVNNAKYTAQGVLHELMEVNQLAFDQLWVDVVGYGHCGKAIVQLLQGVGIHVRVISRRSIDCDMTCLVKDYKEPYPIIINTSEGSVLNEQIMKRWDHHPIILDIVTVDGVDDALAKQYGITLHTLAALPTRFCCESSAMLICNFIEEKIYER